MVMKRLDRDQARRVTAYLDGVVLHRRDDAEWTEAADSHDVEFEGLCELARDLAGIGVVAPPGFEESLAMRLPWTAADMDAGIRPEVAARGAARGRRWIAALARAGRLKPLLPAAALFAIACALVVRFAFFDAPVASAKEVLTRSNAALASLVGHNQLLYRKWNVTSTTTGADGRQAQRSRVIEEWMDGADFDRVAGRWYSADGGLWIAYTTQLQDGEHRPHVYFSPGAFGEPRGVLNLEPTRKEYEAALGFFAPDVRPALAAYLRRQYIYVPITGERAFNRAMLDAPVDYVQAMPRVVLSSPEIETVNGTAVYRVRMADPAAITFNWRSEGAPNVRLAPVEVVRYIARDSFLTVRTEETHVFEDGSRRFTRRELAETRTVSARDLPIDPFKIEVPDGTPVQRQSPVAQLSGVLDALGRLPALTRRLQHQGVSASARRPH